MSRFTVTRETRVLLLVLIVSAGVLLLLARFRFPQTPHPVNPAPPPLERLAARATFDELSSIIAQLQFRVRGALLVLRVTGPGTTAPASLRRLLAPPLPDGDRTRLVPAVRVRPDLAVAALAPGDRVQEVIGASGIPALLAIDPVRLIGLVRVPAGEDPSPIWAAHETPAEPRYVAVAEATPGGPALRPLFVGRTDPLNDIRWRRPMLALGGSGVTQPGSLVFSLEGALEGLTVLEESLPAMAPSSALLSAVDDLEQGRVPSGGDFGIQLDSLSPAVLAATGATSGAVVTYVRNNGPADGLLQVGDVIVEMDGEQAYSLEPLVVRMSRTPAGASVVFSVLRNKTRTDVRVVTASPAQPTTSQPGLGMILRDAPQVGAEVLRVATGGAAADAGVHAGDILAWAAGVASPSAAAVERTWRELDSGEYLLLGVTRQSEHLVLAMRKP